MPVNNAPNGMAAESNCAVCALAGLMDENYGTIMQELNTIVGGNVNAPFSGEFVSQIFVRYQEKRNGTKIDSARYIQGQVEGIVSYLRSRGCQNIVVNGSQDNPLMIPAAEHFMNGYPDGAYFLVLVGKYNSDFKQIIGAHWIAAVRDNGQLTYFDYQTDVPLGAAQFKRTHNFPTGFTGVHTSNQPLRPFFKPAKVSDRMIVVAFRD